MSKDVIFQSIGALTEHFQNELDENVGVVEASLGGVEPSQRPPSWFQQALTGQHSMPCSATSVDRTSLSPIQNEWIRRYTRPGITVNLPLWAEQQPENFSLKYLLSHALENGWDLSEVGWDKAYELEVAQRFEELDSDAPSEYEGWLRHCDASRRIVDQMDGAIEFKNAKTRLSKRISDTDKIRTNGERNQKLLIDPVSLDAWILELRNRAIEKDDL